MYFYFNFYVAKQKIHSPDVTKQFSTLLSNFPWFDSPNGMNIIIFTRVSRATCWRLTYNADYVSIIMGSKDFLFFLESFHPINLPLLDVWQSYT